MRDDIAPLLSGTAIIERQTTVSDSQGGYTATWIPVGTVSGRLEPATQLMVESGDQSPMATSRWVVITPADTDIRVTDRVKFGSTHYEVLGVKSNRTDEITCRAECMFVGIP